MNRENGKFDEEDAPAVVEEFLDRLRTRDFGRLEELLAPDVWIRALLVREVHESTTAAEAVRAFEEWLGSEHGTRMLEAERATMAGRQFLRYRFGVLPRWAPDRWHVIEQTGFCKVQDGRITRMDLACTGYFPLDEGFEVKTAGAGTSPVPERRSA